MFSGGKKREQWLDMGNNDNSLNKKNSLHFSTFLRKFLLHSLAKCIPQKQVLKILENSQENMHSRIIFIMKCKRDYTKDVFLAILLAFFIPQLRFTCSKSTIERLGKGVPMFQFNHKNTRMTTSLNKYV